MVAAGGRGARPYTHTRHTTDMHSTGKVKKRGQGRRGGRGSGIGRRRRETRRKEENDDEGEEGDDDDDDGDGGGDDHLT